MASHPEVAAGSATEDPYQHHDEEPVAAGGEDEEEEQGQGEQKEKEEETQQLEDLEGVGLDGEAEEGGVECGEDGYASPDAQAEIDEDGLEQEEEQEQEQDEGDDGEEGACASSSSSACVGALILRGCRCVLVRSLTKEWEGMRIPWLPAEGSDTSASAALGVAAELCEIEDEEVETLELPPVLIAVPGQPIHLHALYAVNPPPSSNLEEADVEDPEDCYDWYTFPRAMHALGSDPYARMALANMAFSLFAAAAANIVPNKWGGVFGQEWVLPSLKMLPGPVGLLDQHPELQGLATSTGAASSSGAAGEGEERATKIQRIG